MTKKPGTATLVTSEEAKHGLWRPERGPALEALLSSALEGKDETIKSVTRSSATILGRCVSPMDRTPRQDAGLVVGYVQSGKTLSFTAVAAMARDNGFPLVIVIAGTSIQLFGQSEGRLLEDLGIDASGPRRWAHLSNPRAIPQDIGTLRSVLEEWADPHTPSKMRRTALITVMKQHTRLRALAELLGELQLQNVPALLIDDEADQASLNNNASKPLKDPTTTYARIAEARSKLPRHTFLQYTATPQAPLLIDIVDALSPSFVQVIEPGKGYVGGQELFYERRNTHVHAIPDEDIPTRDDPLPGPPESLLKALRAFVIGAACGMIVEDERGVRSMLIHPSRYVSDHGDYLRWVRLVMGNWIDILASSDHSPDREDLYAEFERAHAELALTVPDIPPFDDVRDYLVHALRRTESIEVNQGQGAVPWRNAYPWILVGGQALDRGFTVEGLTVTYMPRGPGVGQADTIQQRGRFFGYKEGYLGYVRVWLEANVHDAFHHYVEHEEAVRADLKRHAESGESLDDWKRRFILDPDLRPTRQSVLNLELVRGNFANKWFETRYATFDPTMLANNKAAFDAIIDQTVFKKMKGREERTETQRHLIARDVPLSDVLPHLLQVRHASKRDTNEYVGLLVTLGAALESDPDTLCTIIQMGPKKGRRRRSINDDGRISNLFQGAYPVEKAVRGTIYQGDRSARSTRQLTVQLHRLRLTDGDGNDVQGAGDVPVIAAWVPRDVARGFVVQDEA